MKRYYRLGGDLFVACAFIASIVGGMLKILELIGFPWLLSPTGLLKFAGMCLLFSMSLSLLDISQRGQE